MQTSLALGEECMLLEQQKIIFLQFWRLKVQDQVVGRMVSSEASVYIIWLTNGGLLPVPLCGLLCLPHCISDFKIYVKLNSLNYFCALALPSDFHSS